MPSAPYLFERDDTSLSFEEADILREYYSGDTTLSEHLESMMFGQSFNGICESSPDLCEDFLSYLAREGGIDYNWISNVLLDSPAPADDEDFIAYLARFNGIIDSHVITDLRRMLKCDHQTLFPPINYTVEFPYEEEEEDDDQNKQVSLQCDKNKDTSFFEAESSGLELSVSGLYDHNGSSYQADESTTMYSVQHLEPRNCLQKETMSTTSMPNPH